MTARPRNLLAVICVAALSVVLTQVHWLIGGGIFLLCAAIATQLSKGRPMIGPAIVGGICGVILVAVGCLHVSYFRGELPEAMDGLYPNTWFWIARQCSFPLGGSVGSLIGYGLARPVANADERIVWRGCAVGCGVAGVAWLSYAGWIAYSLIGTDVKIPMVVVIYGLTMLLLFLLVGSVAGSAMAAWIDLIHTRLSAERRGTA